MIGLADTSVFIAAEHGRHPDRERLPDDLAVSAITVGELRLGVLTAADVQARHQRLSTLQLATMLEPILVDHAVAEAWAGLVASLRQHGRRMPINDSWIAATALAHGLAVVTRDQDFDMVPDLAVIHV